MPAAPEEAGCDPGNKHASPETDGHNPVKEVWPLCDRSEGRDATGELLSEELLNKEGSQRSPRSDTGVSFVKDTLMEQETSRMGIRSLIGLLFRADAAAPPDAMRLDGATETTRVE